MRPFALLPLSESRSSIHANEHPCLDFRLFFPQVSKFNPILNQDIRTSLLRGARIAGELPATRVGHRRFVVVEGVKNLPSRAVGYAAAPWQFRVSHDEVGEAFIDGDPMTENLLVHRAELVDLFPVTSLAAALKVETGVWGVFSLAGEKP